MINAAIGKSVSIKYGDYFPCGARSMGPDAVSDQMDWPKRETLGWVQCAKRRLIACAWPNALQ